jgi:mannonate dehydratase
MKLGERLVLGKSLTSENMRYLKQLGINHLMVVFQDIKNQGLDEKDYLTKLRLSDYYQTPHLSALKEWVENHGLELFAIIDLRLRRWDKIFRGLPGRDQQIEFWCESLRNMGKVGIPIFHYKWAIDSGSWMPAWRTSAEPVGRGGATIVRFDYEATKKVTQTEFGEITENQMWDNLTYFLKAGVPIAEQANVILAMHPADPQVPTLAGISRILRNVEDYDRLFEILPSKYSRMVLCLGCFSQILTSEKVYQVIRHFGSEDKIGYVDFRNVTGTCEKFDEVYPDEGQLDMFQVIKILKEIGYTGYITPDHAPRGINDSEFGHISHAYQIGYIKGLLQAASASSR